MNWRTDDLSAAREYTEAGIDMLMASLDTNTSPSPPSNSVITESPNSLLSSGCEIKKNPEGFYITTTMMLITTMAAGKLYLP